MRAIATDIDDVVIIEPETFGDARGFFFESFNARAFQDVTRLEREFVQDNHSRSVKNVLRGLHYQLKHPQGKLVRVVVGAVFDVAVDLRRSSATFGKWTGALLSAENKYQMWVPEGFAHGFVVLSDTADFLYKTTAYWRADDEHTIAWNDVDLGIVWPQTGAPAVSKKDAAGEAFKNAEVFA